jgi:hypothetical protein
MYIGAVGFTRISDEQEIAFHGEMPRLKASR